jgi:hypothetical protein
MKRLLFSAPLLLLGFLPLAAFLQSSPDGGASPHATLFSRADAFPHEAHAGLFPLCVGCHVGVETGVETDLFPDQASCAACHDGLRADPVAWAPPSPRASNLSFSHPRHQALVEASDPSVTCQTCHAMDDAPTRMSVAAAEAGSCLACHAHAAPEHLAQGRDCAACHVPLTEADRLPVERIAAFPAPASHASADFVSNHAPGTARDQAGCVTCHTRDTCVRCHVNAASVPAITAMGWDERVALLEVGRTPEYPLPATHHDPDWFWGHGSAASGATATCANCHTQPTCTTCHVETAGRTRAAIAALPLPVPGGAPGVDLTGAGARLHPPGFEENHAAFAASGALQCATCHTEDSCIACHVGTFSEASRPTGEGGPRVGSRGSEPLPPPPVSNGAPRTVAFATTGLVHASWSPDVPVSEYRSPDYHPPNFLERHATEVFSARTDCQSCHSTEAFCRDCHTDVGLASSGRLNTAFHTAQPLWLLSHGQAARLNLESCAACHSQTDCLACHSGILGRGVNPHGPGFNAERMASRNRITCRWCHLNP